MVAEFLIPREEYLAAGIHIGMKQRTRHMKPFIYKIRPDGLAVMNLQIIDQRIRIVAKFLARAKKILIISRKSVAHEAIDKFSEIVGAQNIKGRFMPGMLTNPDYEHFYEAGAIVVIDPLVDYQAVKEAATARVPVIGICDTFNETNNIDIILPANNKGIRSLTVLFWLLAREVMKERGQIKSDEEFKYKLEDFTKGMSLQAELPAANGGRRTYARSSERAEGSDISESQENLQEEMQETEEAEEADEAEGAEEATETAEATVAASVDEEKEQAAEES